MPFAQGSRSGLAYGVQSNYLTAASSMIDLPFNTHSLDLSKTPLESGQIRSDRQNSIFRHGNRVVGGDIVTEFRADDFDDLLESAMFGEFNSSSELKAGVTQKFLTIEHRQLDITQYRRFYGCEANSFNLSVQTNAIVMATFNMVGEDMETSTSPIDASITPYSSNEPFDSFNAALDEGGTEIAVVSGLEFTMENGINPAFVVGSPTSPQHEYGRARLTGNLTLYWEDNRIVNKFLNETETTLQLTLEDPDGITGNNYTFLLPRVKINGAPVQVQNEQGITITAPFIALYDSVEGSNIVITKS